VIPNRGAVEHRGYNEMMKGVANYCIYYRVFHRFWQAKFADGGLILGLSQFTQLPPAASKNDPPFKNGRN